MGEVNGLVTQTALAIRDADELEVAASVLAAALRRAKAEGVREASGAAKKLANGVVPTAAMNALNLLGVELDARAAQIEEGE